MGFFDFGSYGLYEWVRFFTYLVGVPVIVYLLRKAARQVRDIREQDIRLREEEAANPQNPWMRLSELMTPQEPQDRSRKGKQ